jgi:hypothetical protein
MWEAAHYIYQGLRATKVQGVINTKLDFFSQLPKGGEGCECVLLCVCVCVCVHCLYYQKCWTCTYTHMGEHTHTLLTVLCRVPSHIRTIPYHFSQ